MATGIKGKVLIGIGLQGMIMILVIHLYSIGFQILKGNTVFRA